jgi:hypothetical protein
MISSSPVSPANNNAPVINGYAEPLATVKIFSDSGCTTQIGSGNATSGATFAIPAAISDDTAYIFYANATDASGNIGLCSTTTVAFNEDSSAPALPTLTATAPVSPSNVNTPVVTGTGTANESIRLYSNAACTTQIGSGTIDGSGNYSVGITLSSNTTTQIYAKSSDAANNSNGCTTLFLTYVEDSAAPPLTISPIAPASPANNNNPVLAGTSEAAATVGLFSDAACTTSLTSMAADGAGAFSFNLAVANKAPTITTCRPKMPLATKVPALQK